MRKPLDGLPAKASATGKRQLTVTFTDDECNQLEALRRREMARSWGEVIRLLIARSATHMAQRRASR